MKTFFATLAAILVAAVIIAFVSHEVTHQKEMTKLFERVNENNIRIEKQAEESKQRYEEELRLNEEFKNTHPDYQPAQ